MGLIHLDAGVVIGLLDADDAHHESASAALARLLRSGDRLAMAASALAECLVGPQRRGPRAVTVVDDLVERLPIEIADLDRGIAHTAASLRSRHSKLRLPDALVIATAIEHSADELITTDRKWPTTRALKLDITITHI
ncbi:MAG: type II toxin-antitoxin system VapC family toxin [Chloroflexota bacterium]